MTVLRVYHPDAPVPKRRCPEKLPPGVCWFCLANPNVEKHLVVSVGDHVSWQQRGRCEGRERRRWCGERERG